MHTIEITKLLDIRGKLEDIRADLTPDTINGDKHAQKAREYVWDAIDDLRRWEGVEITPAQITATCKTLDKARAAIEGMNEEIDNRIYSVLESLEAEESKAIEPRFD